MFTQLNKQTFLLTAACLPAYASPVVFSEDFTSTRLAPNSLQANLGGVETLATFGEISVSSDASIENGALVLTSSSGFRGVGIAFEASQLVAGATYNLSLDVIDFELSSPFGSNFNDSFQINVYTGNSFLPDSDNSERLFLNSQSGELEVRNGSATSTEILSENIFSFGDSPNTGSVELSFNYDGSDALAIFLGAVSDGFPFPEITIDNIVLSEESGNNSVPEPRSVLLLSLSSLLLLRRKRS